MESLEEIYQATKKRSGGQCEWEETVRVGYHFKKVRCSEIEGQPAKNYKGTVHLIKNFKTNTQKETKETIIWLCLKHTFKNDKKIKRPPRTLKKKRDKDQIDLFV